MPRALEPGATFDVVLACDKDKEPRPTFVFRALNGRDWKAVASLNDRLEKADNGTARIDLIFDAIRVGLTDWQNMVDPRTGEAIPYNAADLDLLVDSVEAWELLGTMLHNGRVSADDKKKSESPA